MTVSRLVPDSHTGFWGRLTHIGAHLHFGTHVYVSELNKKSRVAKVLWAVSIILRILLPR